MGAWGRGPGALGSQYSGGACWEERYVKAIGLMLVLATAGVAAGTAAAQPAAAPPAAHGSRLFISVWGANYVSVADTAAMREIRRIPAANDGPATIYATPDNRRLYLENGGYRGRTASVIDPERMVILRQIPISGANGDRATRIQRDGRYYYISTIPQADITQIDVSTDKVTRVYKSQSNDFTVSRDGKTLFLHKSLNGRPSLVSVDVASGKILGSVSWTQTEKDFFRAGVPYTLMSEDGRYVFNTGKTVHMIDVADPAAPKVAAAIPVGLSPLLPGLSPDGRQLWVPNAGDGTISVIDTQLGKVVQTITTGRYMTHVAFDPDGSRVYVAEAREGGPRPAPKLILWLYLVKMGLGGLFGDKQGVNQPRPLLDTPGEVVAYSAHTYRKLDLPAVETVSVPAWIAAVARP